MRIEKSCTLSKDKVEEICELELRCNKEENLKNRAYLSNEINFDKEIPCFFMGYKENRLVAFLTTFMPTSEEAEIIAFTDNEERNKGYFNSLFTTAEGVLLEAGVRKVLFQVEPQSMSGLKKLKKFQPNQWERSEYTMSCSKCEISSLSKDLKYILLEEGNKDIYVNLSNDIFDEDEDYSNLINAILNSEMRVAYMAYHEREPIGVFNLAYEDEQAYCYGVGICNKYRGKGFGKQLMKFALEEGLNHTKKIVLDVDSNNSRAYELYKKCGFKVDFQVDYYAYKLEQ